MIVLPGTHSLWNTLSLYLFMLTAVPLGLAWAPQPVRRDRRVITTVLVLVVLLIGVPAFAAIVVPPRVCEWWWMAIECWLG